jgi:hypothetical protein
MHGRLKSGPHEESKSCLSKFYCKNGFKLNCFAQRHCTLWRVNVNSHCRRRQTRNPKSNYVVYCISFAVCRIRILAVRNSINIMVNK